jgi:EAL domain-containing protein (putative c-di-GMP-specific phosphodiesterase class I)
MSINVAAAQLIEPDFVIRTIETARLRGVDPSDIVIEITETQLIQSFENAAENLKLLKRNGFNIAMDDFGTGYSSLSYIRGC